MRENSTSPIQEISAKTQGVLSTNDKVRIHEPRTPETAFSVFWGNKKYHLWQNRSLSIDGINFGTDKDFNLHARTGT